MGHLSVVISAYNEEINIEECIKSVDFADEVIVVDNNSIDKTAELSKKLGAVVYSRPNNLMLNINKNFGFSKAKNQWILCLDADERITEELRKEILDKVKNVDSSIDGFSIPRKNIIFGKWIKHTGWYPDYQLRLFRKDKGKFAEEHVHEQIDLSGNVDRLDNPIQHESYKTIREFLIKFFTIYAPNEADVILSSKQTAENDKRRPIIKYQFVWKDLVQYPISEFINRFYAKKGYRDGIHGLVLSMLMAFYYFVVYCYVWEKSKFVDNSENIRKGFEEETRNIKTLGYWQLTSMIDEEKNIFKKITYRIIRRVNRLN